MEQRPLRLGDLVDDYCPRERRVTNHAIVAIVNDTVRQTRCTTCEAEHVFRGGKAPRRRSKSGEGELAPADNAGGQLVTPAAALAANGAREAPGEPAPELAAASPVAPDEMAKASEPEPEPQEQPREGALEEHPEDAQANFWPANRQLIRATLPRIEGEAPPRPIPEFTIYQRQNGRGRFQQGRGWQDRGGFGGNGARGGDRRSGQGFGGQGQGQGHGQGRRRHGKKRSR